MVVNFGLIGAGSSAKNIANAIKQMNSCKILAVYAVAGSEELAKEAEILTIAKSVDELLNRSDIDSVIISTPHYLHYELTLQALKKGKNVLCEKPLAISIEQAEEMVKTAKEQNKILGTFYQNRFLDASIKAKELIKNNELGTILQGKVNVLWNRDPEYYEQSNWRGKWATEGGGSLINQASHSIDLVSWLLGEIDTVFGFWDHKVHKIEVDDNACAIVKFKTGTYATIATSTCAKPGYPAEVSIIGSKGSISIDGNVLKHIKETGEVETYDFDKGQVASFNDPKVFSLKSHTRLIQSFVDAVEKGEQPPVSGEEGIRSLRIIEGIYKSNGAKIIKY